MEKSQLGIPVTFRVQIRSPPANMHVFVTGDCPALGDWIHSRARPLEQTGRSACDESVYLYTATIRIQRKRIAYRFFIGRLCNLGELYALERAIAIHSWEAYYVPRTLSLHQCEVLTLPSVYGDYDFFQMCIDKGWLTGQTEIRLCLQGNPISMFNASDRRSRYLIRCVPTSLPHIPTSNTSLIQALIDGVTSHTSAHDDVKKQSSKTGGSAEKDVNLPKTSGASLSSLDEVCRYKPKNNGDSSTGLPETETKCKLSADDILVSVLDGARDVPYQQPECGVLYTAGDIVNFILQTWEPDNIGFTLHLYCAQQLPINDECSSLSPDDVSALDEIASAFIFLPRDKDAATITVPIVSAKNCSVIGQLTVNMLIIHSLPNMKCDMRTSFTRHWKRCLVPRCVHIGHRGMGSSFLGGVRNACVRENTIASLCKAGTCGADYVEFDVMLSSDRVPVVYHDYLTCCYATARQAYCGAPPIAPVTVPVHELSFCQLQKRIPTATLR